MKNYTNLNPYGKIMNKRQTKKAKSKEPKGKGRKKTQ